MAHDSSSTFKAQVTKLSREGKGVIYRANGDNHQVYFVPGTWPGDEGLFEALPTLEGTSAKYREARLVELLIPSPQRVAIACPHQGPKEGQCGGCPWMLADYQSQLKQKVERVKHSLERVRLAPDKVGLLPIWPSPEIWGYRNRAQLKTDGVSLGFVSHGINRLAPIKDCLILTKKNRETLRLLMSFLPNQAWRPGKGFPWNYIDIDENLEAQQIVLNRRRPFAQGNSWQNQKMREWVAHKAGQWESSAEVLELFCGSGNFTEVLSPLTLKRIVAVEANPKSIEVLKNKNLPRVEPWVLDLYETWGYDKLKKIIPTPQYLVINPPREGLKKKKHLKSMLTKVRSVLYISCDPESFVFDALFFKQNGLKLVEVRPLDQFPHTPHVELLAQFVSDENVPKYN